MIPALCSIILEPDTSLLTKICRTKRCPGTLWANKNWGRVGRVSPGTLWAYTIVL